MNQPELVSNHRARWMAILFALVFPTVITWIYFVVLQSYPAAVQQGAYLVGKIIQFGFPIVWIVFVQRERPVWRSAPMRGLGFGLAFGLIVAVAMLALYFAVLKPSGFFEGPDEEVRKKISGMGLTQLWKYALVAIFYALCHSFLEEYYWRWFVFAQMRTVSRLSTAVIVSSLGFMAHHVLVLATFFGWSSPATWLFAISVAVGGAMWALLYHRAQSLIAPWFSHCLVDAAIFIVGYDLARELF